MPTVGVPRRAWGLAIAAIFLLAFVARLVLLLRGGGLLGVGIYDDGVYYSAADSLVHGRLPYRDFLFLQPPGVLVVLAPFARLGGVTDDATGFIAARLAFMLIGAVNGALIALLLRRFGIAAAVVGGALYSMCLLAAYAAQTTLLEPLGSLGVLLALVMLGRASESSRWALLAGVALGAAIVAKTSYVLPALVIVAFHPRRAVGVLLGMVAAAVVLCLPFFVQAPAAMFREVLLDQLGRHRMTSQTPLIRAFRILGLPRFDDDTIGVGIALLVALLVILVGLMVLTWTAGGTRVYVVLFLADSALLLASPSFFVHYLDLTATPLALIVGIGVGRAADALRHPRAPLVLTVGALVTLAVINVPQYANGVQQHPPAPALQGAAARVSGCITSDDPTMLIVLNVLTPDLRRGCAVWPDVTGYTYDRDDLDVGGRTIRRQNNPAWQRDVLRYLQSGRATIVVRRGTGLSAASIAALDAGAVLARDEKFVLRRVDRAG